MNVLPKLRMPVILSTRPVVDPVLASLVGGLLLAGLVILASASVTVADADFGNPFHYLYRQIFAIGLGSIGLVAMVLIPTEVWQRLGFVLLLLALSSLALVLVPGVGLSEKGATRWVSIAGFTVQMSDPARLALILYVAGYIVRRKDELQRQFLGLARPMFVLSIAAILLLAEPDFGAATVLLATTMTMLFVGGARLRDFMLFFVAGLAAMTVLAISSPYRLARLTGFLNPWDDPYNSGFQLTQSLIAIGRGEWFGVGLGASVQKLFYLPEAHTDFVFAVYAEEFGLLGSLVLIGVFCALIYRVFSLARQAAGLGLWFQAYTALGIGTWLGLQAFINFGVNMGLLPTKGLTLPLISYGRSSLIMTMVAIGLLFRIYHEVTMPQPVKTRRKRKSVRKR